MVADVGREIDGEADAHDQVDQGNTIKSNSPPSHVSATKTVKSFVNQNFHFQSSRKLPFFLEKHKFGLNV